MMKRNIINLFILAVATILVTSCNDKYPIKYDDSNVIVGMSSTSLKVNENGNGSFGIYLGAVSGTPATDVVLQISTDGIAHPAIEGTDFTLSTKNPNVPVGVAKVTVNPVDNSEFTGDKQFKVSIVSNSKNYEMAVQQTIIVTIADDKHPLKNWIGTYKVAAASYGSPGEWDEEWTVTTSPVAGDPAKLALLGIAKGNKPAIATFNTVAMTITIETPQDLGEIEGKLNPYWGEIYYGTDVLFGLVGNDWANPSDGILAANSGIKLTGTIEADGTIKIDRVAPVLRYGTAYYVVWDMFNTTWTKQ